MLKTVVLFSMCCIVQLQLFACTAFQLRSEDGAHIYCRTLEFGYKFNSDFLIVPREMAFSGTTPTGEPGLQWKTVYGYAGMNQSIAKTIVSDGMNEKGLVVGTLYLPGFAQYETPDPMRKDRTLGAWELTGFLLGMCATVEDVKAILPTVLVAQEEFPGIKNFVIPLHLYVGDNTGATIAVEYIQGKLHVFDNPLGVLTNSPPFPWHLYNLSNYVNLSPINVPQLKLSTFDIRNHSQGTGLLGLPGDVTPPSRFIRATLFSNWADSQKTATDAVRMGFHILNTFDIFNGLVKDNKGPETITETTEWIIVHDRTNLKSYFRTYESLAIQMVDLTKIDFKDPTFRIIDLQRQFVTNDVTSTIHPLSNK